MKTKGVIFDVDGTLVDSMAVWGTCYATYMKRRGLDPDPDHISVMKTMSVDDSGAYLKEVFGLPESAREVTNGFNAIILDFYMNDAEMKPHMLNMLDALKSKNIPMMVATASSEDIIEPLLGRLGIRHYFKEIVTCRKMGMRKNNPDFFTRCAEIFGIDVNETVVVEDMPHAAKSAKSVGMSIVGVYDEPSKKYEYELRSISDVFLKTDEEYEDFIKTI